MPKEYVYKITLDDSDVKTTLSELDSALSTLGQRTEKAFNKVGTSLSASTKKASSEAKKAVQTAVQSQKQAEQAASRLEKQYIKLLAAELKLAAGSDQATQEFIKQAAAGAQSGEALAKAVTAATSLTRSQVQQAETVAFLRQQITQLSAALSQEGADTNMLTQRQKEYQAILERILAAKAQERAAAEASAAAKREEAAATAQQAAEGAGTGAKAGAETPTIAGPALQETEAAAKGAAQAAEQAEKQFIKLLQAELQLAAGSDKATKQFIKQAAAGAQTGEALASSVEAATSLTEAEVQQAQAVAKLQQEISSLTAALNQEGADTEAITQKIQENQAAIEGINSAKAEQRAASEASAAAQQAEADAIASAANQAAQAQAAAGAEAEASEQRFVKLLQAELKVAAGSDQVTQEFIKLTGASAQTGEVLLQAVSQTNRLSQEQLEFAEKIALTKLQIIELTAEMNKEGADVEALSGQIKMLEGSLESMNAEQQKAASEAQAVADNVAEQARAQADAIKDKEAADKKAAAATAKSAIEQRKANRAFAKLAKSFPEVKQGLVELTGQYGTFKTVIGGTGATTGSAQREIQKLFRDNPKFAAELRLLTKEYGNFTATVRRSDFGPRMRSQGQNARQLGFALQRMGISGVAAFGEIFAALGPIGIAIGAIIVPIVAVTRAFKELANTAKETFEKLIKDSFEAAKAFETTEAAFKAIFDADPTAVNFALRSTRDESERLGVALEELLPKILPKVSDLDQAFKVAELIPGLAASAIDLGPSDALRSIIEALAGDLVSLRKAFEIDVTSIRKAQEEFGLVDGLIIGLTATLEGMGLSFADQADTINIKLGQLEQKFQSFKLLIGSPIVDALKVQFEGFFNFLEANEQTLDNIGTMIGMIVGNLATDIGETIFDRLEDIDPDEIERIANAVGSIADDLLNQIAAISDVDTGGIAGLFESISGFVDSADKVISTFRLIGDMLGMLGVMMGGFGGKGNVVTNTLKDIAGEVLNVGVALETLIRLLGLATGAMAKQLTFVSTLAKNLDDVLLGRMSVMEALEDAQEKGNAAFLDQLNRASRLLGDYEVVTLDAAAATNKLGEESGEAANSILSLKNALKQLNDEEGDFLEKQQEINEKIQEFAIAADLKFQQVLTDMSRNLQKASIDNSRKLIDIETKNRQKIDDIRSKFGEDVIDSGQDLSDKEADIIRKHGRKLIDIEDDLSKARIKAEQKFRDELERIRDKFDFDAFEATLANDAKRLAQLRRRQAFEEKQAKKDRDRDVRDIDKDGEDRKKAQDRQLEQQLQDARIQNARKIRDLNQNLQRQLDAQDLARKRDIEAQAQAELRKRNDLRMSLDQQLEDYDSWWTERHRRTTDGILEDLQEIQQWVEDRNALIAQIQGITEVAAQTPLGDLRQQALDRFMGQMLAQGTQPTANETSQLEALFDTYTRETLENIFNQAGAVLGLPNVLQQRALDLLEQKAEEQGIQVSEGEAQVQFELISTKSADELNAMITELVAELAGIEMPTIPEGFSVPITPGGPPQSGISGATGGFGGPAEFPFAVPPPGMGFPPSLSPDAAQFENFFLPGNLLPPSPALGFDPEAFFDSLVDETQAQAEAELEKRGEIAETVDLAALLAEQRSLLHASLMDEEVLQSKVASDAQIAILEATLEKQRTALAEIRGDEDLQVDIQTLEESIRVLEELIAESKAAQAAAAEEAIATEVQVQTAGEEKKRDEVDTTSMVTEQAWIRRQQAARKSLGIEVSEAKVAATDEVTAVQQGLVQQGQAQSEFRVSELEAEAEHSEVQQEIFDETQQNLLDSQSNWWQELLRLQNQGIIQDLNMMQQWLQQRQILWQQMQLTLPGQGGGLPTLPDDDGGDSGGQASLAQLQQLAISLAEQLGLNIALVTNDVMQMSLQELQSFVFQLQEMLDATGLQIGGSFLPNQLIRVGEAGEEVLSFNRAGRVDPIRNLMAFSPPTSGSGGGVTNIDQSIQVGFDIPDPRGLSPLQIRAMENIAAGVVKKSLSGKVR